MFSIIISRSLTHFSVSPGLLLIPFIMFFISIIVFSSSVWYFLIFSTSFLRFSLYSSLSPNSVGFLFSNGLNSLFGKLFISVSLFVFTQVLSSSSY